MNFTDLPQELKDYLLTKNGDGILHLLDFLDDIKIQKIDNIIAWLKTAFEEGKKAGSCKCGGSCGCGPKEEPFKMPDLDNPYTIPTSMPCAKCGIDLMKATAYYCTDVSCPSFYKPTC